MDSTVQHARKMLVFIEYLLHAKQFIIISFNMHKDDIFFFSLIFTYSRITLIELGETVSYWN